MSDPKNFKIIQTVASGGTAVLFKAVQTSLDRVVAIKRLHQHLTDDENFTRRFILEAKAAASLDHENIVHVIDFGREGDCYQMVLEFVEGESLHDILERWRPIKPDLALAIVHQICLGLEHAHAKGIVHRDIKPGNIMLTEYGRIKIADFGLAKLTQASTSQTAANSILGTPLYMSPEQAFGESVDQRSDLFSLGTVLYELLTGKQPFRSENYMGVIQNIIHKEIPTVAQVNPDLPSDVTAIVSRALSKDRERRFQSAREFRESIEDYLGVLRLNELSEKLRVLLEKSSTTQIISDATAPRRAPRRARSNAGLAALIAFVLLAAGSTAAIIKPSLLDRFSIQRSGEPENVVVPRSHLVADAGGSQDYLQDFVATIDDGLAAGVNDSSATTEAVAAADSAPRGGPEPSNARESAPPSPSLPPARPEKSPGTETAATTQNQDPSPVKKVRQGWLSINAKPNAEVYVDGVYQGDTPPALSLKLTSGDHKIECRHPRYESYSEVLKITTGELSRRDIALKKLKGIVSLATQEGAEFFVDGVLFGVTPILKPIELDAGPHVLTIKKEGFFVWNSEVSVEPNEVMPLRITLSPRY